APGRDFRRAWTNQSGTSGKHRLPKTSCQENQWVVRPPTSPPISAMMGDNLVNCGRISKTFLPPKSTRTVQTFYSTTKRGKKRTRSAVARLQETFPVEGRICRARAG